MILLFRYIFATARVSSTNFPVFARWAPNPVVPIGAGNEFSYFMLMVSNFVLNGVVEVRIGALGVRGSNHI